ncbi:MAG: efflux RND transporter periplasmic adaptor subunit [Gammaproteobacteria bacterium]|nr:MAG: efflux RND transporter periplasmic adaptor subunit [Gammaproteobacteria bacterium]
MKKQSVRGAVTASVVILVGLLSACSKEASPGGQHQQQAGPAKVQVYAAQAKPVTLALEHPGRIAATRVAEVRARVAGIVLSRHFQEGSDVKAGQLLFRIDPAPMKAALSRAEGELARTDATLAEAKAVVERYTPLVKVEAVSQQEFDTAQAAYKSAQAARQAARADVETARLNLEYTTVKAPIAGRIGKAMVTEGALVGQGEATPLATIQQLHPIYADFTRPVADVVRDKETNAFGGDVRLTVAVEGSKQVREGRMVFTNASVEPATGQIALRGEFPNKDGLLLPGMYVRVKAADAAQTQAVLIPQRAIKRDAQAKPYVLLLGKEGKVEHREVKTGRMMGGDWHIEGGLNGGEQVIVGGATVNPGDTAVAEAAPSADGQKQAAAR